MIRLARVTFLVPLVAACASLCADTAVSQPPQMASPVEVSAFDVRLLEVGISRQTPGGVAFEEEHWWPPRDEIQLTMLVTTKEGPVVGLEWDESRINPRWPWDEGNDENEPSLPTGLSKWRFSRDNKSLLLSAEDLTLPEAGHPLRVWGQLTLWTASETSQHHILVERIKPGAKAFPLGRFRWHVSDDEEPAEDMEIDPGLNIHFSGESAMRVRDARLVDAEGRAVAGVEIKWWRFADIEHHLTLTVPRQEDLDPQWRLEIDLWSGLRKVRVPFEFTGADFEAFWGAGAHAEERGGLPVSAEADEDVLSPASPAD
ncbi:MAG: hypothetical protein AAF288_03765 [Planctomycetota bacterium]